MFQNRIGFNGNPQQLASLFCFWAIFISVCSDTGCDHYFSSANSREGSFSSPDLSSRYQDTINCTYIFEGNINDRVNISFDHFNLVNETKGGCNVVFIDIYVIDVLGAMDLVHRICGETPPKPYTSVDKLVRLVFKVKRTNHKKDISFKGNYKFVDEEWQPFPKSDPRCGETFRTGPGGEIMSPNYPGPYPINVDCTWMIKVPEDQTILINVNDMSLDESIRCNNTYISFWNGFASPEIDATDTICGQLYYYGNEINGGKDSVKEFKSTFFRVVIRFFSRYDKRNHQTPGRGFRMSWTAVSLAEESPCPHFECEGGEYCIDSGSLLCNPLPKYCIDESLLCNGVVNCGAKDHSDEFGCWTLTISLVSTFGGIILIAVLTVLYLRYRKRQLEYAARNPASVYYQSSGIKAADYEKSQLNGKKIAVSYSPVKKLSSPGYIAVYSPQKKGFSVFDEYDSETCWNKDQGHEQYIPDEERKALEMYVNHSAHVQKYHHPDQFKRDQKIKDMRMSPVTSHKPRQINNSHSMTLINNRKSQYNACPTFPTPPESDPEVDPYIGHTYANVKDGGRKNVYTTMPRVNPNSVSAVV